MNWPWFSKTWRWPGPGSGREQQGGILVVAVFMVLAFSCLGFSLITFSRIHIQLSSFRRQAVLRDYACENGLKLGLDTLLARVRDLNGPLRIESGDYEFLLADIREGGPAAAARLMGSSLSENRTGSLGEMEWDLATRLDLEGWNHSDTAFHAGYRVSLRADGSIRGFSPRHGARAEVEMEILAGRLPLAALPFVLGRDPRGVDIDTYLSEHGIGIESRTGPVLPAPAAAAGEDLMPENGARLLSRALKIREFSPGDLPPAALRQALGLEISPEPVPDGVYLIEDDLGLGGVFVQGDVEEMVLAVSGNEQAIGFQTEAGRWLLRFDPAASETRFTTPSETRFFHRVPLGIVYVTGCIRSLSGGIIDESGEAVPVTDREVPCLRRGVNLTIVSPEEITLTSHLIREGVDWSSSVPWASDADSHLEILAASTRVDGTAGSGSIRIAESAPDELKLTASLTAAGEGLFQEGEGKEVRVLGGLHITDYSGNEGALRLTPEEAPDIPLEAWENSPLTAGRLLLLRRLEITEWRDHVY